MTPQSSSISTGTEVGDGVSEGDGVCVAGVDVEDGEDVRVAVPVRDDVLLFVLDTVVAFTKYDDRSTTTMTAMWVEEEKRDMTISNLVTSTIGT